MAEASNPPSKRYPFVDAFMGGVAGHEKQWLAQLHGNDKNDSTIQKALQTSIAKREQAKHNPAASMGKRDAELYVAGQKVFNNICAACHGTTGDGITNVAPPLAGSQWVMQKDKSIPIRILLDGLNGPITVAGKQYGPPQYTGSMPALRNNMETNNGDIAGVLTYVRNAWGNKAPAVMVEEVARIRQATAQRVQPYTAKELQNNKPDTISATALTRRKK